MSIDLSDVAHGSYTKFHHVAGKDAPEHMEVVMAVTKSKDNDALYSVGWVAPDTPDDGVIYLYDLLSVSQELEVDLLALFKGDETIAPDDSFAQSTISDLTEDQVQKLSEMSYFLATKKYSQSEIHRTAHEAAPSLNVNNVVSINGKFGSSSQDEENNDPAPL